MASSADRAGAQARETARVIALAGPASPGPEPREGRPSSAGAPARGRWPAALALLAAGLATVAASAAEGRPPQAAGSCAVCHSACPADPGEPPCLARLSPETIADALVAFRAGQAEWQT
ncbi:hypothetical protein ABS774_15560, partial [Methylobacterium oxalidis]